MNIIMRKVREGTNCGNQRDGFYINESVVINSSKDFFPRVGERELSIHHFRVSLFFIIILLNKASRVLESVGLQLGQVEANQSDPTNKFGKIWFS